jgi:hypothetical protein
MYEERGERGEGRGESLMTVSRWFNSVYGLFPRR